MIKPLVVVDEKRREIFVRGKELRFPPIEFAMIAALVRTNEAMTREQLSEASGCCGGSSASRTIDQHIARARRRLGRDRDLISTVTQHGYRFDGHKKK